MDENRKEMNQEQMKGVNGGDSFLPGSIDSPLQFIIGSAHCRACGNEMVNFKDLFRCQTAGCSKCGKDKTAAEVDWL